ncbi:MAG: hypothetical protein JW950_10490 [Deltaproteobacteria bacterium]|nr:hypothetical protein [Deltaproteobacteria bacterium]
MKRIIIVMITLLFVFIQSTGLGICEEKCVEATGEAAIVAGDISGAKMEATARAKWAAIEQVAGTEVKAQSFIQDFALVEDVVKTQAQGVVKSYKTLGHKINQDAVSVKIRACVEPTLARDAVSFLALNSSVAVFIPARKPGRTRGVDEYEETNLFSERLIEKLTDQDYTVIDVAPTQAVDAAEIEKALKGGSTLAVRSMMYKFLSNVIVIGKIDYTISTRKGEDIGYGLSMPFNAVTVRLTYRIVTKNPKTGNMEILTAGTEQAKGLANNAEDAAEQGLEELAERLTPDILDKVAKYIQGNVRKVSIKINGVPDLDTNMEIRETLQGIVWVSDVEAKRIGDFVVGYPENPVYLANSLRQKGRFTVVNFSPYSITLDYR